MSDRTPRDAIHAAVMRRHAIRTVVSYDCHFDELPDIERVTPQAALLSAPVDEGKSGPRVVRGQYR